MRALAAVLDQCRVDRLTRQQHIFVPPGEMVAYVEAGCVFAERVVNKPTVAIALERADTASNVAAFSPATRQNERSGADKTAYALESLAPDETSGTPI